MLIGENGQAVVLDARTCAWLERYAGLSGLRVRVRGVDPEISKQLEQVRAAAMSWRGSAIGTEEARKPEPAATLQWLSTTQVGDLLAVSSRAVVKAIARGSLEATWVGNRWQINREDVEHYRAARAA